MDCRFDSSPKQNALTSIPPLEHSQPSSPVKFPAASLTSGVISDFRPPYVRSSVSISLSHHLLLSLIFASYHPQLLRFPCCVDWVRVWDAWFSIPRFQLRFAYFARMFLFLILILFFWSIVNWTEGVENCRKWAAYSRDTNASTASFRQIYPKSALRLVLLMEVLVFFPASVVLLLMLWIYN